MAGRIFPRPPNLNPQELPMSKAHGYAALAADLPLAPFAFERREPGPQDVRIEIL